MITEDQLAAMRGGYFMPSDKEILVTLESALKVVRAAQKVTDNTKHDDCDKAMRDCSDYCCAQSMGNLVDLEEALQPFSQSEKAGE